MSAAVLLLAHGAPEHSADVDEYLKLVRGGRPLAPHLVEEIRARYEAVGGGSPLTACTRAQAEALEKRLRDEGMQMPVYFGMRNWRPLIKDTLARMQQDGIQRIVAICLAPQYSKQSVGLYQQRTEEAMRELGYKAEVRWAKAYYDHPLLIEAFADRLARVLPAEKVLFTAHSLPARVLTEGDLYDAQARTTARLVAEKAGQGEWDFAYQSQGLTDEPWLGPRVEEKLEEYSKNRIRDVVVAPISFVSDNVEILYDVDILFRGYAAQRGIRLRRPESLNDHPSYIAALAAIAQEEVGRA